MIPQPDPEARERQIREREAKATKGPWIADDFCEEDGNAVRVGTTDGSEHYYHRTATVAIFSYSDDDERTPGEPEIGRLGAQYNAEFCAHARADIPYLFDQLTALRSSLQQKEEEIQRLKEWIEDIAEIAMSQGGAGDSEDIATIDRILKVVTNTDGAQR